MASSTSKALYNNPFQNTAPDIDADDLARVERTFGFQFPEEIRKHYLAYNGGGPTRYVFKAGDRLHVVNEFLPIRYGERGNLLEDALRALRIDRHVLPDRLIPFAVGPGGDYYCFSAQETTEGSIYLCMGEYLVTAPEKAVRFLAASLPSFINALVSEAEAEGTL
jgi:hypothetical protein